MPAFPPHALFTPLQAGEFELSHRIVMPAMRRGRAGPPHGVPGDLMARYYAQRATRGGLLVTETSWTHAAGHGDGREPGLYTPEQVNAWRVVTGAVRRAGGVVVAQLGDPSPHRHADPRDLVATLDVDATLRRVRDAAESAGDAGFDGIELLATVPELFFHDRESRRGDEYSGDLPNRTRLLLDTVHTLAGVWPAGRIGLRLSAVTPATLARDPDALAAVTMGVAAAVDAGIAYVHVGPAWRCGVTGGEGVADTLAALGEAGRPEGTAFVASGGFDATAACVLLDTGLADAVAFGRPFLANPDLPWRLRHGAPLADWSDTLDPGEGEAGYTDFPVSARAVRPQAAPPTDLRCDEGPWSPSPR